MSRQIFRRLKSPFFVIVLLVVLVGVFFNAQRTLAQRSMDYQCPKCLQINRVNPISYADIFIFGVLAGLSPCLIALTSFILVPASYSLKSPKGALKKLTAIAGGVFYFHILIAYVFVPELTLQLYTGYLIIPLAVFLVIFGSAHFMEAFHDFYTSKWRNGGKPAVPLFKTPRPIREFIQKVSLQDNLYLSFSAGVLFSFVKSSCTIPILLSLVPLIQPFQSITSVTVFSIGVIYPMLLLGLLLSLGLLKIHQLYELRLKGRIIQRTIVGTALIVTAFFVLYTA